MSAPTAESDPTTWVEQHGDCLFAYAMSKIRNREVAEEVVQETFLAALRHQDQYRGAGEHGAWLMGILKRKVIDHFRSASKQPMALEEDDSVVSSFFDGTGHWTTEAAKTSALRLDSIEREEFREIFSKCIERLPSLQSMVFLMKEVEEKDGEEVCKLAGITSSNLWVLMHRARLRLAECIKTRWSLGNA